MARETQKEKIARLEEELRKYKLEVDEYKKLAEELNNEIASIVNKKDSEFESSSTYKQMIKRIKNLELKNESLKDTIDHNNEIHKLLSRNSHNNRGAGRKSKFTEGEKETMKMYRFQGKTIKEIAEIYKCSVGLVHKLINE